MKSQSSMTILLAEDNPFDALMTSKALTRNGASVYTVEDGQTALDFLFKRGSHYAAQRPRLVLLDLNLPVFNGLEVLKRIKDDKGLRRIPVVILTSSRQESDILAAYDSQAAAYLVKPVDDDEYPRVLATLSQFWLNTAILPNGTGI